MKLFGELRKFESYISFYIFLRKTNLNNNFFIQIFAPQKLTITTYGNLT